MQCTGFSTPLGRRAYSPTGRRKSFVRVCARRGCDADNATSIRIPPGGTLARSDPLRRPHRSGCAYRNARPSHDGVARLRGARQDDQDRGRLDRGGERRAAERCRSVSRGTAPKAAAPCRPRTRRPTARRSPAATTRPRAAPSRCRTAAGAATISVPVLGDTLTEGTETFTVNLSAPVNGTIGDAQAIGTIYDNEGPPALVVVDGSADESAGTMSFGVIMTSSSLVTETVDFATRQRDGRGRKRLHGHRRHTHLHLGPGEQDDHRPHHGRHLERGRRNLLRDAEQRNRGRDRRQRDGIDLRRRRGADDRRSRDASAAEASGTLSFTISLSTASGQEVDVDYTTTDGTAIGGSDFTATGGTAVIAGRRHVGAGRRHGDRRCDLRRRRRAHAGPDRSLQRLDRRRAGDRHRHRRRRGAGRVDR